MSIKVILAAGGSGGHIFPSVALAGELEKMGVPDIFFVSSTRNLDRNILKDVKHKCFFLSANPMPRSFNVIKVLTFIAKVILDTFSALFVIIKTRPDVVVGFGGYSSGTITKMAGILKIPVIIHEQNFLPGRANKILGKNADVIAVSFKDSDECFPGAKGKIVFTGNPIRTEILSKERRASAMRLGLSPEKFTILVMGGSQGATFLNRTASEAALRVGREKNGGVQFIHLSGKKDYSYVTEFYEKNNIPGKVFAFLEAMGDAYAASDMAVSRSGAAAIFELAYYALPMILVPYPNPKNNQGSNAVYFSRNGAAIYKDEKELSGEILSETILSIINDENRMKEMSKKALALSRPQAARSLAEEVVKLAGRKTK